MGSAVRELFSWRVCCNVLWEITFAKKIIISKLNGLTAFIKKKIKKRVGNGQSKLEKLIYEKMMCRTLFKPKHKYSSCTFLVSHHTMVWGIFLIVQIFNFRILVDLHVLGSRESPKHKISLMSWCSLVN